MYRLTDLMRKLGPMLMTAAVNLTIVIQRPPSVEIMMLFAIGAVLVLLTANKPTN